MKGFLSFLSFIRIKFMRTFRLRFVRKLRNILRICQKETQSDWENKNIHPQWKLLCSNKKICVETFLTCSFKKNHFILVCNKYSSNKWSLIEGYQGTFNMQWHYIPCHHVLKVNIQLDLLQHPMCFCLTNLFR